MAHSRVHYDGLYPNDTGGPLDIVLTEFGHGHGTGGWSKAVRIWLCVDTTRRWRTRVLKRKGEIWFNLDTRGDDAPEFFVRFRSRCGYLGGDLINARTASRVVRAPGYRYSNKSGACVYFKKKFINPVRTFLRYSAWTYYKTRRECPNACSDQIRRWRHYL
jgi:hypothetical protein